MAGGSSWRVGGIVRSQDRSPKFRNITRRSSASEARVRAGNAAAWQPHVRSADVIASNASGWFAQAHVVSDGDPLASHSFQPDRGDLVLGRARHAVAVGTRQGIDQGLSRLKGCEELAASDIRPDSDR